MDLGADRRGVDMGPSAVRVAAKSTAVGAWLFLVVDGGNINVRNPEMLREVHGNAKYLPEITEASVRFWPKKVNTVLQHDGIPIVLGGDHSIAIGSSFAAFYRRQEKRVGMLWFDAWRYEYA
ncbi:MAG: arginase family protein [Blastocatellia bacterium]